MEFYQDSRYDNYGVYRTTTIVVSIAQSRISRHVHITRAIWRGIWAKGNLIAQRPRPIRRSLFRILLTSSIGIDESDGGEGRLPTAGCPMGVGVRVISGERDRIYAPYSDDLSPIGRIRKAARVPAPNRPDRPGQSAQVRFSAKAPVTNSLNPIVITAPHGTAFSDRRGTGEAG